MQTYFDIWSSVTMFAMMYQKQLAYNNNDYYTKGNTELADFWDNVERRYGKSVSDEVHLIISHEFFHWPK